MDIWQAEHWQRDTVSMLDKRLFTTKELAQAYAEREARKELLPGVTAHPLWHEGSSLGTYLRLWWAPTVEDSGWVVGSIEVLEQLPH